MLAHQRDPERRRLGVEALTQYRHEVQGRRPWISWLRVVDTETAREQARTGQIDAAITLSRKDVDGYVASGELVCRGPAFSVLVDGLLTRGTEPDIAEARAAIDKLAATPVVPGFVLHELPLLWMRARLADAVGDVPGYRDTVERYRVRANQLGFAEHVAAAAAMTR
jgi:hypothetical protein